MFLIFFALFYFAGFVQCDVLPMEISIEGEYINYVLFFSKRNVFLFVFCEMCALPTHKYLVFPYIDTIKKLFS